MRMLFLLALGAAGYLLYKMYLRQLLAQGTAGRIKIGLIVLGFVFLALAVTGRAPALFAVIGAVMTQAMRFWPLLIRFAPGLKRYLDGSSGNPFASGPRTSQVKSATLAMTLDHESGTMNGKVLGGEFVGSLLADLTAGELVRLHAYCRTNDLDALRLLEAYVARERSAEFDNAEELGGAAGGASSHGENGSPSSGDMSVQEAREVLGVADGANREAIVTAHRTLMSRLHPDKGGSDYLASKVNLARKVLLEELMPSD